MALRDMSPPGRRSDVCDVRGSHDVTTLVEQPEQRSDAPCCVTRTATVRQDETCSNTCSGTGSTFRIEWCKPGGMTSPRVGSTYDVGQ